MTENPTGATGAENNDRSNDAEQPQTSHNPNVTPTEDFGAAALSSNDSRDGYRPADQGYAAPQPQAPQSQQSPQQPSSQQPQNAQQGQSAYGPIPQRPASFPTAAGYGANAAYGAPQNGQPNQPTTPYPAYGAPRQGASNPFAQTAAYPATGASGQHQQAGQHGAHAQQGAPAGSGSHNGGGHGNGTGAFGPAAQHQPSSSAPKRRPTAALLVATLAIGALIGGAAGAGSYALIDGSGTPVASSSNGSQSVTINDTTSVTRTSAVAAKASPSVVTIAVQGDDGAGTGSGVILSKDGYVLTNNHVITLDGQNAKPTIQVTANDGKIYSAKIVGTDPVYDLAVIKLDDASGLEPMEFGDPNKLNVGDVAIAIGAPLGLAGTVTDGIVSALNRSITVASSAVPEESGSDSDSNTDKPSNPFGFQLPGQEQSQTQAQSSISLAVIQTDASINPGNSGGALLDSDGKLIGINVAIASAGSGSSDSQSGSIGVGFAIPSDTAERIAKEIIKDGKATHGLLGASVRDAAQVSGSTVAGALLGDISSGGAAEKGGLKTGDIVTNFNGHPVTDANDLTAQVRALAANSKAEVTYVRDGKSFTVDVTLGELVL
jgi:putative serine protease PepD